MGNKRPAAGKFKFFNKNFDEIFKGNHSEKKFLKKGRTD